MSEKFSKYKMVIIPVAVVIIIAVATGIYFAANSDKKEDALATDASKIVAETELVSEDGTSETGESKSEKETKTTKEKTTDTTSETTKKSTESSGKKSASSASSNKKEVTSAASGNNKSVTNHKHVWKEHKAKRWVSKMVTVDDYEEKKTPVGTNFIFSYDGYTTSDINKAKQHAVELIYANKPDNYRTETIYKTEKVKTGSHKEDHGHYETYVDYYYCTVCGAVKK